MGMSPQVIFVFLGLGERGALGYSQGSFKHHPGEPSNTQQPRKHGLTVLFHVRDSPLQLVVLETLRTSPLMSRVNSYMFERACVLKQE